MDYLKNSVAIHQPNYLPWLGYFYKIFLVDHFIFHDDVDFNQRSYTKRTLIRKERSLADSQWLIMPIQKSKNKKISKIKIADGDKAIAKHLRKLKYIYQEADFFNECFPFIEKIAFDNIKREKSLGSLNINLIESISQTLELKTSFHRSSQFEIKAQKNELNIELIQAVGGSKYVSGTGAKNYQSDNIFQQHDIQLHYSNALQYLQHHPYEQAQGPSLMGLSIIDAWMNLGKEGIIKLFEQMLNTLIEDTLQ